MIKDPLIANDSPNFDVEGPFKSQLCLDKNPNYDTIYLNKELSCTSVFKHSYIILSSRHYTNTASKNLSKYQSILNIINKITL